MRYLVAIFLAVSGLVGSSCSSLKAPDEAQAARLSGRQAAIYVGKRYLGLTPREIRVRRSFGETSVTLRRGKDVLRRLEIEWSARTGSYLPYLFGVDTEGDAVVYDLQDLERLNDSTYTVPNLGVPTKVRDPEFGLTVWITD